MGLSEFVKSASPWAVFFLGLVASVIACGLLAWNCNIIYRRRTTINNEEKAAVWVDGIFAIIMAVVAFVIVVFFILS